MYYILAKEIFTTILLARCYLHFTAEKTENLMNIKITHPKSQGLKAKCSDTLCIICIHWLLLSIRHTVFISTNFSNQSSASEQQGGKGGKTFQVFIYISHMNSGPFLSSLPFANQLPKNCSLLQNSLKYHAQKKKYVGLGRKVNIWPITLSPTLAEKWPSSVISTRDIFPDCGDLINMKKILYFLFMLRPLFFFFNWS